MTNAFKNQYTASGTQTEFNFTFLLPITRKVNVYVQQGASANEVNDIIAESNYTLQFTDTSGQPSAGKVIFNTAPASGKIVTITPDDETAVSYEFLNTVKFNASNLNNSFKETSSTNNYQLSNYINASLRYNFNENDSLITYSPRIPPLADKGFWRREGSAIISQDYTAFVGEVETAVKANLVNQVNATYSNTNLSADIANKTFGQDYSGDVKRANPDGTIVNEPITPGKSALSGAQSARLWAENASQFTDAYGNTGFSSRHYALQAQTAAGSSGGVITELFVKKATPVTRVDLIDYSVSPNQPWINVLKNSFTVYVDGEKLPEPIAYSDGTVTPDKPYDVTIETTPTLANPSYITFTPAIAANSVITIARSEAQGNSATMFVDNSNATFTASSKLAARDFSNVDWVSLFANDNNFKLAMLNYNYPVGSRVVKADSLSLPGSEIPGVTWAEVTNARGNFFVGESTTGSIPVTVGQNAGTLQTCDPMTTANLIQHNHGIEAKTQTANPGQSTIIKSETLGASPITLPTNNTGQPSPSGIGLTNIRRYGLKIFERTA